MNHPQMAPDDAHNRALLQQTHPRDWVNPAPNGRYHLVVIGAGTAGPTAAAGCAAIGGRDLSASDPIRAHQTRGESVSADQAPPDGQTASPWMVTVSTMSAWPQRLVIRTIAVWMAMVSAQAWAERTAVDQTLWDDVLARYVHDGRVDYAGLMTSRASLESYLYDLAQDAPEHVRSGEEQLAFWINAYNACVLKGVLDHYPVPSVKRIAGFFDRLRYRIAGQTLTLDQIESAGRMLGDWRLHMALVCASVSCPPLRAEAYVADRLEAQLTDQTRRFLNDPTRGLRLDGKTLRVSPIFKWYAEDFVPGARRFTSTQLLAVLKPYGEEGLAGAVERKPPAIGFLDYDWSLNDTQEIGPQSQRR